MRDSMRIGFQRMKRAEGLGAGGESFAFSNLRLKSACMSGAELFRETSIWGATSGASGMALWAD
jgi:hypothetical protein